MCVLRGDRRGGSSEGLTDCLNITAAILDVAGAESLEDSDGVSFVSQVLAGPDADGAQKGKDAVFSEVDGFTMVFDGQYKLVVESASEKPVEMYDCQNDPSELNNVFEDPDLESVRRDLIDTHLSGIRDRLDREKLESLPGDSGKDVFSTRYKILNGYEIRLKVRYTTV